MSDLLHSRELVPHLPAKFFEKMVEFIRSQIQPTFSYDKSGYLVVKNNRRQGIRGLAVDDRTFTISVRPIQDEDASHSLNSNPRVNIFGLVHKARPN